MGKSTLSVRPTLRADISHIVEYWTTASQADCDRMGVDFSQIPPTHEMEKSLLNEVAMNDPESYHFIWEHNGVPIGHVELRDVVIDQTANIHLHIWDALNRGKGHGKALFCKSVVFVSKQFRLKKIFCEPRATNVAPNKLLQEIGFPLVKTYTGESSVMSIPCELNRYEIIPETAKKYLEKNDFQSQEHVSQS